MKTCNAAVAGRRSGLTLIEVLATVFVLGMGLIMVGAAFPVGIDQMRRTKEDTQAAELARSTLNMIRAQGFAQKAAVTIPATAAPGFTGQGLGYSSPFQMPDMSLMAGSGAATAYNMPAAGMAVCDPSSALVASASWAPDLVSNPNALAYGQNGPYQTSNIFTLSTSIVNGSLVCIPVLTRMASPLFPLLNSRVECAGVPLYRVTLVVVKYTGQLTSGNRPLPLFAKGTATVGAGNNGIVVTGTMPAMPGSVTIPQNVNVDDGVLISYGAVGTDYRTGYVYRVVDNNQSNGTLTLDDNPGVSGNGDCLVFFNFVAAYYAYIGG